VTPEVLRISGGADAPAVLRFALHLKI